MPKSIVHSVKDESAARGGKVATIAWVVAAVYFFYQYALRSSPSVMIPQLSEGLRDERLRRCLDRRHFLLRIFGF
jgi:hypothetical protein